MTLSYWKLFELLSTRETREPVDEATDALAALPFELWSCVVARCSARALWRYSQCCARASRDLRLARFALCGMPVVARGEFNRFFFDNYAKPRVVNAVLEYLRGPQKMSLRLADRRFLERRLCSKETEGPGYRVRIVPKAPDDVARASNERILFQTAGTSILYRDSLAVRTFHRATQAASQLEFEYQNNYVTVRVEGPAIWTS